MNSREDNNKKGVAKNAAPKREGIFDHAVFNLHHNLDAGEKLFRSLGFNITPRGYHSLGSMNNLIVFGTDYLELVGLDPDNPKPRKELLDWPIGLNGLVYGSDEIESTRTRLLEKQLPILEAKAFNRPVTVAGETMEARFRTANMGPGYFPASRLYFCEHQTPELVWHDSFMTHANTAFRIDGIAIASTTPEIDAGRLASVLHAVPSAEAEVTEGGVRIEFGLLQELTDPRENPAHEPLPRAVAIRIGVRSLGMLKASLDPVWTNSVIEPDGKRLIVPAARCFGVAIEFIEQQERLA